MRLPQVSGLVKDDLLKNLDGYARRSAGTSSPPPSCAAAVRHRGRPRGEGSLYAMGLNFSMTGVFYNKKLAAQIGMSSPPTTLARARRAPGEGQAGRHHADRAVQRWRDRRSAFPLQNLMSSYGPPARSTTGSSRSRAPRSTRRRTCKATQHLQQWIKAGYFEKDANATDYATMMSQFIDGEGLFMFDGDWESGNLDKQMAGNAGFFLMPPPRRAASTPRCRRR